LESCGNVNTDKDVQVALCLAAEEISGLVIGCAPGATPSISGPGPGPGPDPCLVNVAPTIDIPDQTFNAPGTFTLNLSAFASDPEGDPLTYSIATCDEGELPEEMNIDGSVITWKVDCSDADCGTAEPLCHYCIEVTVKDECHPEGVMDEFTLTVNPCQILLMKVEPAGKGTTTPVEDISHLYAKDSVVPISVSPISNYKLDYWKVDGVNKGDGITEVTMDTDHTVTAVLKPLEWDGTSGSFRVAFEDLKCDANSDNDYNDWIADIKISTNYLGDYLKKITFDIFPIARGAGYDHIFHLKIPKGTFDYDGKYSFELFNESLLTVLTENGDYVDSTGLDVKVIPWTDDALLDQTNAKEGCLSYVKTKRTSQLVIDFGNDTICEFDSPFDSSLSDTLGHGTGFFIDPYLKNAGVATTCEMHAGEDYVVLLEIEGHEAGDSLTAPYDYGWKWPLESTPIWQAYGIITIGTPPTFSDNWWDSYEITKVYPYCH
jgi:hypothetical protein